MSLHILPLYFVPTLIIALYHFKQASFIMSMQIFVHNDRVTFLIRATDFPVVTHKLMTFHFFPFQPYRASFFKQALIVLDVVWYVEAIPAIRLDGISEVLTLVRAVYYL